MMKILAVLCLLVFPLAASASNQTFIFQGAMTPVSTTITNPYDGTLATLAGTFNVNNSVYSGTGAGNTILMTNSTDFLTLDSSLSGQTPNVQTVVDIQRIVTGNGDDFLDLASANFTLPAGLAIFGGSGAETIWTNSSDTAVTTGNANNTIRSAAGNDTITSGSGNDTIFTGPGTDTITSGAGMNTLDGGTGSDTAVYPSPLSAYSIARTGPAGFTIDALDSSSLDQLSNIEFARFSDQTLDLSTVPTPEPSALCLLAMGAAGLLAHRRIRVA